MPEAKWTIKGREFVNCNCDYGCPCQFNGRPTHGDCYGIFAVAIEEGYHGDTRLDGLNIAALAAWPGAIHEGKGKFLPIVDERATPAQRDALVRIMAGEDTDPGATFFQVFSTTYEKMHEPVFTKIAFEVDVTGRKARLIVPALIETRGEPIVNPVTGVEHRVGIHMPDGFEYTIAEIGRGWTAATGPIAFDTADSNAHFAHLHMTQSGVVR